MWLYRCPAGCPDCKRHNLRQVLGDALAAAVCLALYLGVTVLVARWGR